MHPLAARVREGDKRAVARALTWIENRLPEGQQVVADLFPFTGAAYVIGITGSPGSGKSSLTDSFVSLLRLQGKRVGIVAVDPTSPFTGGALLGDRVRMNHHATDPDVFIRSMGTRGALGGVARATREFVHVLDAYGCEYIFVETVGVGQSEVDIMHIADTVALVLNPGAGDQIQSIKAGVMEIADLFIVNKADLPGADKTVDEINLLLDLIHDFEFRPPVIKTISSNRQTIENAWADIVTHRAFLERDQKLQNRRFIRDQNEVISLTLLKVQEQIDRILTGTDRGRQMLSQLTDSKISPYQVSHELQLEWAREILSNPSWKS